MLSRLYKASILISLKSANIEILDLQELRQSFIKVYFISYRYKTNNARF